MAFCANCGTQVDDGVNFCPKCGASTGAAAQPPQQPPQQFTPPQPPQQQYTPPQQPPQQQYTPPQGGASAGQDNTKLMSILAYILFFVPLIAGAHKTSETVKFHTNQGTVLFIATLIWGVAYSILTAILTAIFLAIGAWGLLAVLLTILGILWLAPAVLVVLGIVNAATDKLRPLPVIGKITIIK